MEVKDYNQRIAEHKKHYRDASTELRKSHERQREELKQNHEVRENKQAEAYRKDKKRLEEKNNESREKYSSNAKEVISKKSEEYAKALKSERDSFSKSQAELRQSYDQKIRDLNSSFESTLSQKDKTAALQKDELKENYVEGLAKARDNYDEKVKEVGSNQRDGLSKSKRAFSDEVRELTRKNDAEKQKLVQDNTIDKRKSSQRFQEEVSNLKRNYKISKTGIQDQADNRVKTIVNAKNKQLQELSENHSHYSEKLRDKNKIQMDQLRTESRQQLRDQEHKFSEDKLAMKRKVNDLLSGDSQNSLKTKEKALEEKYGRRSKNLENAMEKTRLENTLNLSKVNDDYNTAIKHQEARHNNAIVRIKDDTQREKDRQVADLKDRNSGEMANFEKRYFETSKRKDNELLRETGDLKKSLMRQKEVFGNQLNKVNKDNADNMEGLRKDFGVERKEFIEKSDHKHRLARQDMKMELEGRFERQEAGLNDVIAQKEKNIQERDSKYNHDYKKLTRKTAREINTLQEINQERRDTDLKLERHNRKLQQRDYEKKLTKVQNEFKKNLTEVQNRDDLKMQKLVNDYEDLLSKERRGFQKTLSGKIASIQEANKQKLHQLSLKEESMVQGYENKLEQLKLKNARTEQMLESRIKSGGLA